MIAGASGMTGSLVLDECLASPDILQVTSLVRRPTGKVHPTLKKVVLSDFSDYATVEKVFENIDIAFFCIGVYTGQVADELFKKITIDFPVAFAEALQKHSPNATLCFLSGAGADQSEKSKLSFARYKGMAENRLSKMGLGAFYSFRPGYIYPVEPRKEPNLFYRISRRLYPLIKRFGKNSSITSTQLARAMVKVGLSGTDTEVLENAKILDCL